MSEATTLPFTDYGTAGVCARVAYQLVRRNIARNGLGGRSAQQVCYDAQADLSSLSLPMLRMALHSLSASVTPTFRSKDWLAGVVYRDLMGYNFRRCFFAAYKETRSLYPRVTNRGVQDRSAQRQLFGTEEAS